MAMATSCSVSFSPKYTVLWLRGGVLEQSHQPSNSSMALTLGMPGLGEGLLRGEFEGEVEGISEGDGLASGWQ